MENQSENPPVSVEPAKPVLDYRREDRKSVGLGDLVCASIAIGLGSVMLALAVSLAVGFLSSNSPDDGRVLAWVAILLLLLLGVASAARSAWFYFGGWANAPDHGKRVRKIIRPWRWS
jgi:hypothetical protein